MIVNAMRVCDHAPAGPGHRIHQCCRQVPFESRELGKGTATYLRLVSMRAGESTRGRQHTFGNGGDLPQKEQWQQAPLPGQQTVDLGAENYDQ